MKDKLEKRKRELEAEFAKLNEARENFVAQRKDIDQKLSQIQVRQVQLQGSYAEVEELLKPETSEVTSLPKTPKGNGKAKEARV